MKCGDPNNPSGPGHKANGDLCNATVVQGTFRCYLHGGASPTAKFKAETAMALLRMPAIEALHRILAQWEGNTCATCGFPSGDTDERRLIVRTCQTVLDRCGMGPHATFEVKQSDGDFDPKLLTGDERSRMIGLLAQLREIKADVRARLNQQAFGAAPTEQTTIQ